MDKKYETAIFAAGCFWGVEELFRRKEGVVDVEVGYTGGSVPHPTYQQVCSDATGHAEAVKITYDPGQIAYNKLLDIFWENHDPTQVNRQGPDIGSQYRSAIFYTTPEQKVAAEKSKEKLDQSGQYSKPIVTRIEPVGEFYRAEEYHQQYFAKMGGQ